MYQELASLVQACQELVWMYQELASLVLAFRVQTLLVLSWMEKVFLETVCLESLSPATTCPVPACSFLDMESELACLVMVIRSPDDPGAGPGPDSGFWVGDGAGPFDGEGESLPYAGGEGFDGFDGVLLGVQVAMDPDPDSDLACSACWARSTS
ncbi:hypothetical protein ATCC90586_012019 [Pythium insidiosum]|nr:hypothetical protein ATCC90586_012019 [Pythium insidiosum]